MSEAILSEDITPDEKLGIASQKSYLGDGAYVHHDGYQFVLTTENGICETNRVCLEPPAFAALRRYAERYENALKEWQAENR